LRATSAGSGDIRKGRGEGSIGVLQAESRARWRMCLRERKAGKYVLGTEGCSEGLGAGGRVEDE
jgi:hypothetical protein